ncbi:unannotated protein [freshwater metagenome]|uniref:Unannotated protein n=1 Tax=freshwater metagenome TaxID=449393 RepID=A0A6J6XLZ2_9ZZZZ
MELTSDVADLDGTYVLLRIDHEDSGWSDNDVIDVGSAARYESIVEHLNSRSARKNLRDSNLALGADLPRRGRLRLGPDLRNRCQRRSDPTQKRPLLFDRSTPRHVLGNSLLLLRQLARRSLLVLVRGRATGNVFVTLRHVDIGRQYLRRRRRCRYLGASADNAPHHPPGRIRVRLHASGQRLTTFRARSGAANVVLRI